MRNRALALAGLLCTAFLCAGCVERKILIRSEPSGVQVWVDEEAVGMTPVDVPFSHYGLRRIRVGPVRDEADLVTFVATERIVAITPPWYQQFPIDFFAEVLWPGRLLDEHKVEVVLSPASEQDYLYGEQRADEVLDRAEEFRTKSLTPVPELEQ